LRKKKIGKGNLDKEPSRGGKPGERQTSEKREVTNLYGEELGGS